MTFWTWLGLTKSAPLELGSPVPDVTVQDESGQQVPLRPMLQRGTTLLYFYPKAGTPGCTAQACHFRDDFAAITQLGLTVIGISTDNAAALRRFKEKQRLPFPLLADPQGEAALAFGVPLLLGFAHRQSFLIRDSIVVWRDLHASTRWPVEELRAVLQQLAA